MAVPVEVGHGDRLPGGVLIGDNVIAAVGNDAAHIPDGHLAGRRILEENVGMPVSVEVPDAGRCPTRRLQRSHVIASQRGGALHVPDGKLARGKVLEQQVRIAVSIEIERMRMRGRGSEGEKRGVAQSIAAARDENIYKRAGRAVVAVHFAGEDAGDVEVAVRPEGQAVGTVQVLRREDVYKGPGRAVVAQDLIVVMADDIEIAVGAERQAVGPVEPAAGGEDVHEGARRAAVAQDLVRIIAGDVEIAVGAENESDRRIEPAAAGRNERVHERAGRAIIAQDRVRAGAGHVEVAVGAEAHAVGVVHAAAGGEDVQEGSRRAAVAQDEVVLAGDVEIAVRPEDDVMGAAEPAGTGGDEIVNERAGRGIEALHASVAIAGDIEILRQRRRAETCQQKEGKQQKETEASHEPFLSGRVYLLSLQPGIYYDCCQESRIPPGLPLWSAGACSHFGWGRLAALSTPTAASRLYKSGGEPPQSKWKGMRPIGVNGGEMPGKTPERSIVRDVTIPDSP